MVTLRPEGQGMDDLSAVLRKCLGSKAGNQYFTATASQPLTSSYLEHGTSVNVSVILFDPPKTGQSFLPLRECFNR